MYTDPSGLLSFTVTVPLDSTYACDSAPEWVVTWVLDASELAAAAVAGANGAVIQHIKITNTPSGDCSGGIPLPATPCDYLESWQVNSAGTMSPGNWDRWSPGTTASGHGCGTWTFTGYAWFQTVVNTTSSPRWTLGNECSNLSGILYTAYDYLKDGSNAVSKPVRRTMTVKYCCCNPDSPKPCCNECDITVTSSGS